MPDIQNVEIYSDSAFNNLIYIFPQGNADDGQNVMACSDPGNPGRGVQFATGTRYYIRYTIVSSGSQRQWQGDCEYEPGGAAGVQFGEMELVD
ncbi:MAG TPA: hypothetical protein VH352_02650 [Pseudonocardiaceae bacterium]|jgi:hypothetical protein|nr:hypothetical protein [Pseudonocardiaceae bacterium]